jgi:sulfonate transport system substrate-binding protein
MSSKPHRSVRAAVLAAGVILSTSALTACSSGSSSQSAAPLTRFAAPSSAHTNTSAWSKYTFTIGDNGGDGSQQLAAITGVFKNAPYKVKFARFTYGPPLVQAAASGDIDLGSVGDVPPITGAAQEYGFDVVGVSHYLNPKVADEDIIVPKDSKITSVAQLKGKTIAVPQGSSAHGLALLALKSAGLSPNDVHLDFLAPAAGATAFASGKVDAWSIWNPQAALAIKAGAKVIAPGLPPVDQTSNYYVAPKKDLVDPSRKAALTDLFERLSAEFAWGNTHVDTFSQAISKEEGISPADAKSVISTFQLRIAPVAPSDIAAEQSLSTAFLDAKQINKRVDVSAITQNILPSGYDSTTLKLG